MKGRSIAICLAAPILTGVIVAIFSWRHQRFSTTQVDFTNNHTTLELPRASYNDYSSVMEAELHRHLRVTTNPGQTFEADVESLTAHHSGNELEMLELRFENSTTESTYQQAITLGKLFNMSWMERVEVWHAGNWKDQSVLVGRTGKPLPDADLAIWRSGDDAKPCFIVLTLNWIDFDAAYQTPNFAEAGLPKR